MGAGTSQRIGLAGVVEESPQSVFRAAKLADTHAVLGDTVE